MTDLLATPSTSRSRGWYDRIDKSRASCADRAEKWAWDEENGASKRTLNPTVALYRKDRPSYRKMIGYVAANPMMDNTRVPDSACGMEYPCSGGCGA